MSSLSTKWVIDGDIIWDDAGWEGRIEVVNATQCIVHWISGCKGRSSIIGRDFTWSNVHWNIRRKSKNFMSLYNKLK